MRLRIEDYEMDAEEFISINEFTDEEAAAVRGLSVNEFAVFGGGAFHESIVTRIA